jgi:DNA-directed RNA polymerase specialized sigma24 family protein
MAQPANWSDAELIRRFGERDVAAFNELHRRHEDDVKTAISKKVCRLPDYCQETDDIANDFWFDLWRRPTRLQQYDPLLGSLRGFLIGLAKWQVPIYKRKHPIRLELQQLGDEEMAVSPTGDEEALSQAEKTARLAKLNAMLPREEIVFLKQSYRHKQKLTEQERQRRSRLLREIREALHLH